MFAQKKKTISELYTYLLFSYSNIHCLCLCVHRVTFIIQLQSKDVKKNMNICVYTV